MKKKSKFSWNNAESTEKEIHREISSEYLNSSESKVCFHVETQNKIARLYERSDSDQQNSFVVDFVNNFLLALPISNQSLENKDVIEFYGKCSCEYFKKPYVKDKKTWKTWRREMRRIRRMIRGDELLFGIEVRERGSNKGKGMRPDTSGNLMGHNLRFYTKRENVWITVPQQTLGEWA